MPDEIAKQINEKIIEWSKHKSKLVVAVDGYTGIGKTTILNELAKLNSEILAIHQDDFLLSREEIKKLLQNATDRSVVFELKNRNSEKITQLITAFRSNTSTYSTKIIDPYTGKVDIEKSFDLSKRILVIEGVFMFHPKSLNSLWDKRIFLDGNTDTIDERRIKREKEKWGKDYFPEDHPDSYFKQVVIALKRYRKECKPEERADLVLNVC